MFCFLEGETISQLPINNRFHCSIAIFDTLTEGAQGRYREMVIWSVERAGAFECCGITIHADLPGSHDLPTGIETDIAAAIIRFHCGNRQRQGGDRFTKIRRRGLSTVKLLGTKVPVLEDQPVVLSNIKREAPTAGPPALPAELPKLSPAVNDTDPLQYYQSRVVAPIANLLDCDFAVNNYIIRKKLILYYKIKF